MLRKFVAYLLLTLVLITLVSCSNNNQTNSINRLDIQATINADGTIQVKELYDFDSIEEINQPIKENQENIQAYLVNDQIVSTDIVVDELEEIEVTAEDGYYKINPTTEKILLSYELIDQVTKYNDVGDLTYAFFDESTTMDMHDVSIRIDTPANQLSDQTHIFFHSNNQPSVQKTSDYLQFQYDRIQASETNEFRLIFPASELSDRPIDEEKNMYKTILTSASSLQWRYQHLEENFNSTLPFIITGILLVGLIGAYLLIYHSNHYRAKIGKKSLLTLVEETDPLFVSYVSNRAKLSDKDIMAGLFSLQKRGLISITKVPSEVNHGETFRFTWKRSKQKLTASDHFLKIWLFTERDQQGPYFLLESNKVSTAIAKEQKKTVQRNFKKWARLVEKQSTYQELKNYHILTFIFSFAMVSLTLGFIIYFYHTDVLPSTAAYSATIILGLLGAIAVAFNFEKNILSTYFITTFILTAFLTMTAATWLFFVLIGIAATGTLLLPRYQWQKDIKELHHAIKLAKKLFQTHEYPIGHTPKEVERQMQYAILFQQEQNFAEQCNTIPLELLKGGNYPLLINPKQTANNFNYKRLICVHKKWRTYWEQLLLRFTRRFEKV